MLSSDSEEIVLPVIATLLLATILPFVLSTAVLPHSPVSGVTHPSSQSTGLSAVSGYPQSADVSVSTNTTLKLCQNNSELGARRSSYSDSSSKQNVSVAIIDPTGFAVDDSRIKSNIVATKEFRRELGVRKQDRTRHGTATAAVVTRFAPNADLYLATFDTAYGFTQAVEWAIDRDVDVIVAPVSFYAKPNDGSSMVSSAVAKAAEHGIPVVVPTGNVAQKHWEGTYRSETGRWVTFSANDTRMYLRGDHSQIRAWLWWNRSTASERHTFDVILYHDHGDRTHRVAVSSDYPRGPVGTNQVLFEQVRTNNLLATKASNGSYYIRIKGPPNTTHHVEMVTVFHELEYPVPNGSIVAPATAKGSGVIAVGAYSPSTGEPLPSSGRGPTADSRRGIDILAPGSVTQITGMRFNGTSAATAYTGGAVALMKSHDPSLTPGRIEQILEATAYSTKSMSRNASGSGILNAHAAVRCAATDGEPDSRE